VKHWNISSVQIHDQINYQTAKSIIFRGGEPFLSSTNFYVLEQLLKHGNSDCFISFVTNGSVSLTDYQKNLIAQFKNKNFCFSIDGVGPVFEYLRYPLLWADIEKNIQYCRDNNILISASYTISNLNILYHNQTLKWFEENQIRYINNPVYTPVYFQPSALPVELKKHIANSMTDTKLATALLQQHNDQDEQHYQQFRIEIAHQDQIKGIKMKNYLPELAELLGL
jgi:sulfatase maturation enzyme AslB (radical SAM superfamily)